MARHMARIVTVLLGTVLCLATIMQAQYVPQVVKVSVPFEFSFHDQMFPAGDYIVACTALKIELRNARQQLLAIEMPHAAESAKPLPTKIVFVSDQGIHVLRQIWPGGSRYGYEFLPSRSATLLAKQHGKSPAAAGGGTR